MNYIPIRIVLFFSVALGAQTPQYLSMEEAVLKATEHNNSIKVIEAQVAVSKAEYQQSAAVFLPNISASYTGITTTNPLMAFGSKLNQEVLTISDFDPALLNDPDRTTNYATKIEVQQPLLNLDGFLQRGAAKAKYQATQLQQERTTDYLILETKKAYMQLQLALAQVTTLQKTQKALDETFRITQNKYEQGLLQKSDLLAVELRVNDVKNQLRYAESNVQNASNYLSVLFDDHTFERWQPSDSLAIIPLANDLGNFSENRADILALDLSTKAYEKMYKAEKMTFLPRLNAFGSYELYDDEIFQADASGYIVGAQLSWNLFEGSKKFGKVAKSKASLEKSKFELAQYKMESQAEVNRANRMVQDANNAWNLAKLGLEQSEESLRIRNNRYKEGLERTSDLLLAESQFSQKQLEYYNAIYQYNYAQLYLQFLSK